MRNGGKWFRIKVTSRGRVAQLGEHLLCKHEPAFQRILPLLSPSSVSNNFGESATRSK